MQNIRKLECIIPSIEGKTPTEMIEIINKQIDREKDSWDLNKNLTFTPFNTEDNLNMFCSILYTQEEDIRFFDIVRNIMTIVNSYCLDVWTEDDMNAFDSVDLEPVDNFFDDDEEKVRSTESEFFD